MGSIAMDRDGNIGLGYSVSSGTVFPGIRRTGRLASDPPGMMTQPEATIIDGGGAQTHSSSRYGNYSDMSVDPEDDCTFWYTTEYHPRTSTAGWQTRIASFRNPECGAPREEPLAFEYAAKLVCGLQRDPDVMRLVRGFYGTAVNIHNPSDQPVDFRKKLALTFPPEEQKPGKIIAIARDRLEPDEALEVDCEDVLKEAFDGQFPTPYIKGFVVVQSAGRLDVTALYTTAGLDKEGQVTSVSSIDVEQVLGRGKGEEPGRCPDLIIRDIGSAAVDCPGGGGTCVTKVDYTVANIRHRRCRSVRCAGTPGSEPVGRGRYGVWGLPAGADQTVTISTPPGGNCFDPDCSITVTADSDDDVKECNENNNTLSETLG